MHGDICVRARPAAGRNGAATLLHIRAGLVATRLYSGADGNYGGLAQIMRESTHRVLYITAQSNLMNGILPGSEFVEVMPWWSVLVLAMMAVGAVLCMGSCAATVVTLNKRRKQKASH